MGQTEYDLDRAADAHIVTLLAVYQEPVFVPDTYILAFPSNDQVPYSRLVLSVLLGPLPVEYDTSAIESKVAGVVEDHLGFTPQVRIGHLPYTGVITHEDHKALQTARQAAIRDRDTDRAKLLVLESTVQAQQEQIRMLEQLLIDHGVV